MKKFLLGSLALLTLLFVCGLVGSFWLANSTARTLKKLRSEISAAGDPIHYTDYATEPVSEKDNAFVLLSEAMPRINAYTELIRSLKTKSNALNSGDSTVQQSASPDTQKQKEDFFTENNELFDLLEEASHRQRFRPDIQRSQGFGASAAHLQTSRQAIEMLADKANMLASRGEGDAAIVVCLTGYRILKLTELENSLLGFLIECVGLEKLGKVLHQTLVTCEVSEPMREAIDTQLQQFQLNANLTNGLKVERAVGIQSFQDFHRAAAESEKNQLPIPAFVAGTSIGKAYLNDDEAAYIEYMNECISMVNQTKTSRDKRMNAMATELSDSGFLKFVSKIMAPDITGALDAKDDATAKLHALRILLAIQKQPDLQIKSLPVAIRTDPYTSNDMITQKTKNGWLVYSVGRNLTDDAGNLTAIDSSQRPLDVGYGPIPTQPTKSN